METAVALSPIFFPEDSTYIDFELAGLLAHLAFCGLPVTTNRNSGREYKKFLQRLTAAGTAPVFHRIPYSDSLPKQEAHQPNRCKSRKYSGRNGLLTFNHIENNGF